MPPNKRYACVSDESATRRGYRSFKRKCARSGKPRVRRQIVFRLQIGVTRILGYMRARVNTARGAHTLRRNDVIFERDDSVIAAA